MAFCTLYLTELVGHYIKFTYLGPSIAIYLCWTKCYVVQVSLFHFSITLELNLQDCKKLRVDFFFFLKNAEIQIGS